MNTDVDPSVFICVHLWQNAFGMHEVEVKIRVKKPIATLRRLRKEGFVLERREWERDIVLDQEDLQLRAAGRLLRLRRHGRQWLLTFKDRTVKDRRYKAREEIETEIANGRKLELIFERLGFHIAFSYEKQRRTFRRRDRRGPEKGHVTFDHTPIGDYLELEGSRRWIDRTAKRLGFSPDDYIRKSYGLLYREYCAARGIKPSHMLFKSVRR
jgi:adenylate cyclase class 2